MNYRSVLLLTMVAWGLQKAPAARSVSLQEINASIRSLHVALGMLVMYAAVENIEKLRHELVHRLFEMLIEHTMPLGLDEYKPDIASHPFPSLSSLSSSD